MPEMSDQIQEGMANLQMNAREHRLSMGYPPRTDSAFPKVHNKPANAPMSDQELEATLEHARQTVLDSNDAEMQLSWAQDALMFVGAAIDNEERLQATQPPRPGTPHNERQFKIDAMNIVSFLADQHHPQAVFMRGMWFEFGRFGVVQDKKEAFRCYSRSADRGYARAEYRIGMLYEAAGDAVKAVQHYHRGVSYGDSASLYRLGMMTLRGQHGQVQDYPRGVDYIRRSADSADENAPQGCYVYGMLLAKQLPQIKLPDSVLPYDEKEAVRYIELAAFLKFSKAQLKMGSAYELAALGCDFNPALSMHYNRLAARQGEPEADMAISKWFLVGHEGLFPKNEELAYTYAQRAAQAGLSTAEFAIGYFNELGIWVQKNLDIALEWYKKAAANGNDDARSRIEGINRKQVLSRQDHENMAITRIRSQYGSQRGQRPARLAQPQQHPRIASISEQPGQSPLASTRPRASSSTTTPYPLENRPPTVPAGISRPGSAAPYPMSDMPPQSRTPGPGPGPVGGFLQTERQRPATVAPTERPSTAFSIDPNQRPMSAQTMPQHPQRLPSGPAPQMLRPATTGPQGRLLPNNRTVSTPSNMHGGRPPFSGPETAPSPPVPQLLPQPSLQPLDIGFVAPPDDHSRARPPQQRSPTRGRIVSAAVPSSSPQPLRRSPVRGRIVSAAVPSSSPHPPRPLRQKSSHSDFAHPPRTSSFSQLPMPEGQRPNASGTSVPSSTMTPPPMQSPAPSPAMSPPPKKGPKTFEEMGVPSQQKEGECVCLAMIPFEEETILTCHRS